jgi:hypothetical protein
MQRSSRDITYGENQAENQHSDDGEWPLVEASMMSVDSGEMSDEKRNEFVKLLHPEEEPWTAIQVKDPCSPLHDSTPSIFAANPVDEGLYGGGGFSDYDFASNESAVEDEPDIFVVPADGVFAANGSKWQHEVQREDMEQNFEVSAEKSSSDGWSEKPTVENDSLARSRIVGKPDCKECNGKAYLLIGGMSDRMLICTCARRRRIKEKGEVTESVSEAVSKVSEWLWKQ